jgi:hypothetical protein
MTAFFMARLQDQILTIADGAFYHPSGEVVGFTSKMLHLIEHQTVIVCQGPAFLLRYVYFHTLTNIDGFDQVIKILPGLLRHAYEQMPAEFGKDIMFYCAVGGYSRERDRFESYYIRSGEQEEAGHYSLPGEQWELMPAPPILAAPWPDPVQEVAFGLVRPEGGEPHALSCGIRIVAAARQIPSTAEYGNREGACYVGGFIEVSALWRNQYTSEIVHRWPDRIGEFIDPQAGEPMPAFLANLPAFTVPNQETSDV